MDIVGGLEAHHVRYTYARDIRGSDNHTSKLVKRGGFFWRTLIFVRISYKVSQNHAANE